MGSTGPIKLSKKEEKQVLIKGSQWALEKGLGEKEDIDHTENAGCMKNADPDTVSERALERGKNQLGTLGSGNHFLEVGYVEKIYDPEAARVFGLFEDQVTVILHSGSRGFGYQVCDDYLALMTRLLPKADFTVPDRQLALYQNSVG